MSPVSPPGDRIADGPEVRLAIVGSPRSGNTWLRGLLANLLGLEELAVHEPGAVDWAGLPPRCVLQIHWNPTEDFQAALRSSGFRAISPARHPLDLLLSVLNYAYHTHDPARCTREACPTCSILGVSPLSEQFLAYAQGDFARNLLAISLAWWREPSTIRVRYEDLVGDTAAELGRIVAALGVPAQDDPAEVAARFAIESLRGRQDVLHYQYWQGRPGHWRGFLTAEVATRIAAAHAVSFAAHGYDCTPDPSLSAMQADLNWCRGQLESTRLHLRHERAKHERTREELRATRGQLDHVHRLLWLEREQHRQEGASSLRVADTG